MTIMLPLRGSAELQVRELENRIKEAESLPGDIDYVRIEAAVEASQIWETVDKHEDAINQIDSDVKAFQVKIREEVIVKPVFTVQESYQVINKPIFSINIENYSIPKPVFHVEEVYEKVIKRNIEEITEIHNINKNVVRITIGLLTVNLVLTFLEVIWKAF